MARLPDNMRVYAVGDVHGCATLLEALILRIAADAAGRPDLERQVLVFLGDYIDRGPDSRTVIDILLDGLPPGFEPVYLIGNHEEMLLEGLDGDDWFRQWRFNGADETLESYGITRQQRRGDLTSARRWAREMIGQRHMEFFNDTQLTASFGEYLFVHAGVRPEVALDQQISQDLLWIREPFLSYPGSFGRIIVHGHTPAREPVIQANRIGLDTGAFQTGRLTAARLEGDDVAIISVER